jgi:hypothetical protein
MGTWESFGTPESSKFNCKGQNTSHWGVLHIIGKLSKCKCPKWVRMTHLNICNTSYGQKKGRKSNWQFDSQPRKVGNRPDSFACDTSLKSSRRGLQLWFRSCPDRRSALEVIVPQSCRTPILGDFGTPTWESRDKKPFGCHSREVV